MHSSCVVQFWRDIFERGVFCLHGNQLPFHPLTRMADPLGDGSRYTKVQYARVHTFESRCMHEYNVVWQHSAMRAHNIHIYIHTYMHVITCMKVHVHIFLHKQTPICVDVSSIIYILYIIYTHEHILYMYTCTYVRVCRKHIRVLMSDSLAIDIGEDIEGETEKDERAEWETEKEATVMDRPISAARWSTRETERARRRDQRRIFSTYGTVRDGRWKTRETKGDRERERSWSGRSLANRRTRSGPVAASYERNSTSAILLRHHLSPVQLLCNLLSTRNEFSSARPIIVIKLLWH